jgi:hypothetical protein
MIYRHVHPSKDVAPLNGNVFSSEVSKVFHSFRVFFTKTSRKQVLFLSVFAAILRVSRVKHNPQTRKEEKSQWRSANSFNRV